MNCVLKNCLLTLPVVLSLLIDNSRAAARDTDIFTLHGSHIGDRFSSTPIACLPSTDPLNCLATSTEATASQLVTQAPTAPNRSIERVPLPGTDLVVPTPQEKPLELPLPSFDPLETVPSPSTQPAESSEIGSDAEGTVVVRDIVVEGNTVLDDEIEQLVQEFVGQRLNREGIAAISDAITQLYLNEGYITSRAIEGTTTPDGTVTIPVVEGQVVDIEIANEEDLRLISSYIRSRIARGTGTPPQSCQT